MMPNPRKKANEWKDERAITELALAGLIAYVWIPISVALVITPIHEILHVVGALIEGAQVTEINVLLVENWIQQYFLLEPSGPIGQVVAQFSTEASGLWILPSTSIYYFLPYVVGFPLALFLIAGDNVGISNKWRIVGAPMLFMNFVAFWTDYALFKGLETGTIPVSGFMLQAFYVSVILIGITGTTWLAILKQYQS